MQGIWRRGAWGCVLWCGGGGLTDLLTSEVFSNRNDPDSAFIHILLSCQRESQLLPKQRGNKDRFLLAEQCGCRVVLAAAVIAPCCQLGMRDGSSLARCVPKTLLLSTFVFIVAHML